MVWLFFIGVQKDLSQIRKPLHSCKGFCINQVKKDIINWIFSLPQLQVSYST